MESNGNTFWVEDPCALFSEIDIIPKKDMDRSEKLNSLTRLLIIVVVVLYFFDYKHWLIFLLIGLLLIIIFNYYSFPKKEETQTEDFTITPTYTGTDFQQTVVAPTYAEEWQIPPPAYDLYTNVPDGEDTFETPLKPQSYPYGQYLTKTNLLPSDEYYIHNQCGGTRNSREYANSTFLRNDLAFRENMSRVYKKSLNRRFRNSCLDTVSPYQSY